MLRTGIVGVTGYTGSELLRLLYQHPEAEVTAVTSESQAGKRLSDVHAAFAGFADLEITPAEAIDHLDLDAVFLALPHGVSMEYVRRYRNRPFKIIDLSGDFRLSGPGVYEEWYRKQHVFPEGIAGAAYGLPELHREAIRAARLVANPGCYPTCSILGLAPLLAGDLLARNSIIVDAKSGATGAGAKAKATTHFSNVFDNFKSYGLKHHRHTVEIEEQLSALNGQEVRVQFTPHLLPVDRGILATIYCRPHRRVDEAALRGVYEEYYRDEPFVRLRSTPPELKDVRGTNLCDIFVTYDARTGRIIVLAAIDNLVKGAAGAAIQNLNLMFGLPEDAGLRAVALTP